MGKNRENSPWIEALIRTKKLRKHRDVSDQRKFRPHKFQCDVSQGVEYSGAVILHVTETYDTIYDGWKERYDVY